ncbi:hypothetical protein [uncultured Methanobrevibacter sp.]|uniref:hypothetical protein n=1 Tax=uncultured Methanobrevibacter sp. TaxID=253161 RepID=UPI002601FA0C|nr:hypothetical protein [uncultured Methanobrevibacter sp.]
MSRHLILAEIKIIVRIVMGKNIHQPTDKSYKFMYKRLGIEFHRYFFGKGENISFLDTEIPISAKRRDITCKVDDCIWDVEFQSYPVYEDNLENMFDYHESLRCDKNNNGYPIRTGVINTSNPNRGKKNVEIKFNINFHPDFIFTQEMNGEEILSTLINKVITHEELSNKEAIDLLILPDMDIEMPIKALMRVICFLIANANIPDDNFKNDIILCEISVLKRFFAKEELSGMVQMLIPETENPKIAEIISQHGPGFDVYYFDGKADGIIERNIEIAKNALREGIDVEVISRLTGLSIDHIEQLKRKL